MRKQAGSLPPVWELPSVPGFHSGVHVHFQWMLSSTKDAPQTPTSDGTLDRAGQARWRTKMWVRVRGMYVTWDGCLGDGLQTWLQAGNWDSQKSLQECHRDILLPNCPLFVLRAQGRGSQTEFSATVEKRDETLTFFCFFVEGSRFRRWFKALLFASPLGVVCELHFWSFVCFYSIITPQQTSNRAFPPRPRSKHRLRVLG